MPEFFKTAWPIIVNDFLVVIKYFFPEIPSERDKLYTILAIIPKKEEVREMKDYRPIS